MPSSRITFPNEQGQQLAARLELPANRHPHAYALFAHCFTCSKNLMAVRNISRALNQSGVAVLRFDFTGLGDSEGDFADTNFSSNVEDLLAAAAFLAEHHQAPSLLIGHSLGGAAVLNAADRIPSARAVVTIGAPFEPAHVKKLIQTAEEEIHENGEAEVSIGGRNFRIREQFLRDIQSVGQAEKIAQLDKALLILHSPQDRIVSVENAAQIYHQARHPKSFISLDGADHLLSDKEDSYYAGEVIGAWVKRYLRREAREELKSERAVAVRLGPEGFTTEVMVRHHALTADEPTDIGGNDFGPTPYELLSAGLAACTAMTLQMYARRKKWDIGAVTVHIDHRKDYATDLQECEKTDTKIDHFDRHIELTGDLSDEQRQRLLEIADRCPVHRTLHTPVKVRTELEAPAS